MRKPRNTKKAAQQLMLCWYEQMVFCYQEKLSPVERRDLEVWDSRMVDATVATSDWPGWEKHIGKKPQASVTGNVQRRYA